MTPPDHRGRMGRAPCYHVTRPADRGWGLDPSGQSVNRQGQQGGTDRTECVQLHRRASLVTPWSLPGYTMESPWLHRGISLVTPSSLHGVALEEHDAPGQASTQVENPNNLFLHHRCPTYHGNVVPPGLVILRGHSSSRVHPVLLPDFCRTKTHPFDPSSISSLIKKCPAYTLVVHHTCPDPVPLPAPPFSISSSDLP